MLVDLEVERKKSMGLLGIHRPKRIIVMNGNLNLFEKGLIAFDVLWICNHV